MAEHLFSYGTLQELEVQLAIFGRGLQGEPDALAGYRATVTPTSDEKFVAATGRTHNRTLEFTGEASDFVAGTLFVVTRAELDKADRYEPHDYERRSVELRSGRHAWVYLKQN